MFKEFKSLRRDYTLIAGVVGILLGIFVIGGITHTYNHRPSTLSDAAALLFHGRQLPADL
jgi:hypothetical protein